LKCYHPAEFCAALINSQPMGFYAPAQLIADAIRHGVEVRRIDVNHSDWDCTLEKREDGSLAIRLGFRMTRGLSEKHIDQLIAARRNGPFTTFADFVKRTGLRAGVLKRLSNVDAFQSMGLDRQSTLWRSLPERGPVTQYDQVVDDEPPAMLPPLRAMEEVLADYRSSGLSLRRHPISFLREFLDQLNVTPADKLPILTNGQDISVAGLVLLRQRPSTSKGVTFVTLEDETGPVNLIVRRAVWEFYRRVGRTASAMIAHGKLQVANDVVHVLVNRMEDLSERIPDLNIHSRDFH
jgi:error-prone DNA polymerase